MTNSYLTPIPELFIDKISITRADPDRDHVQHNADAFASYCRKSGYQFRSSNRYAIEATIPIPTKTGTQSCLIQLGAWQTKTNAYRVECNPSKLGSEGRDELDTLLLSIAGETFQDFVLNGKVTRLDVAIDLPGITTNDVIVRSSSVRKHGVYSGQTGIPETIYVGTVGSTVAYDKGTAAKDGITRLRIERRLKPNCPGRELPNIKNPLERIRVVPTEALNPLLPAPADVYFDSMRIRGIHRVLKMLPRPDRLLIERVVDNATNTLLPPDIWKSWPTCLRQAGLAAAATAAKEASRQIIKHLIRVG